MNFNDIPNQLRAPFFFSEISVNGSVPTVQSNNDPAPPLISCDGASQSFYLTTMLEHGGVEVSVDGGDWEDLYNSQKLAPVHYPSQVGARLILELAQDVDVARVVVRANSMLGLYVNHSHSHDQVEQSNQAYTLFDEHDNVVDPRLISNHVYGENIFGNDPETDEDYAVYFKYAEFCLRKQTLISCDGATNSMSFSQISGVWSIYVNDFETPASIGDIGTAISQIFDIYIGELMGDYNSVTHTMYIQNVSSNYRIKLKPISGTSFIANTEDNPTFIEHEDGSLTFCLSATV